MSERKMPPASDTRRYLFCVISLSIFLLFFSCFALLNSRSSNSLLPESVLMFVLTNNTSSILSNNARNKISYPNATFDSHKSSSTPHLVIRTKPNSNEDTKVFEKGGQVFCAADRALLKVYMYDMPPEFHFGLLDWRGKNNQIWPDVADPNRVPRYPGGLNLQHSVEYWLTLDLLSSNNARVVRPCTAVRVENSSLADVVFVPFFSSLSYNRHSKIHGKERVSKNKFLQDELVRFLMRQEEWKRTGGKDHVIVAHHPNSLLDARKRVGSAMLVLADFGRYPEGIANLRKDIIAPYRHVVKSVGDDSMPFEGRPILVYFQGAIHRKDGGIIRQELYQLLKDEKAVHFSYGSAGGGGIRHASQGMASSRYCLNIAGDTPSSNRLFDAIVSHCVPVIISDEIELPFEDILDYSKFCIFVRASDAVKKGFLLNLLRGITNSEWTKMWEILKRIAHHFEYQYPSKERDAVQMIWEEIAHKLSLVRLKIHKDTRFHRSQLTRV